MSVSFSTGEQLVRTTPRKARNTRKTRKRSFCFSVFRVFRFFSCLSWLSPPALPQRDRQVTPGVRGVGIQRQRELKLIDGFLYSALQGEREPEDDVRVDGIRHQPHRRTEMINVVLRPASPGQ